MDPIAALLGLDVDLDDEKTRALADSLRGRKRAADFFSVSTIDPIAKMAQTEGQDVLTSAQTAGGLRRAMQERQAQEEQNRLNREQQQTLQDERLAAGRSDDVAQWEREQQKTLSDRQYAEGQTKRGQLDSEFTPYIDPETKKITYARSQEGDLVQPNDFPADITGLVPLDQYKSLVSADGKAAGFGSRMPKTAKELEMFQKGSTEAVSLDDLNSRWKDSFISPTGTGIIGEGTIANKVASGLPGLTSKNRIEAMNWWKDYKRSAELLQKHEMFGSALTESEKQAWAMANIDENLADPGTIRRILADKAYASKRVAQETAFQLMRSGYDQDAVYGAFGDVVNVDGMYEDNGEAYMTDKRKRFEADRLRRAGNDAQSVPDAPISPTGDYSDEEEQRYQELKARQAAGEL